MYSSQLYNPKDFFLTTILAGGVFTCDLLLPRGFAEEMLYTGVVFFATQRLPRRMVFVVAIGCTALTIIGFALTFFTLGGAPSSLSWPFRFPIINRAFCIGGIWAITLLALQRRRALEALRTSEDRFGLVAESIQDYGIVMLDQEGNVASWNAGAAHIFGYLAGDVLGRPHSLLYPDFAIDSGEPTNFLAEAMASGSVMKEQWLVRKNGSRFWGHMGITVLRDENDQLHGFATVMGDLTKRKQEEDVIRALLRLSEKLNSTFVLETLLDELVTEAIQLVQAHAGFAGLVSGEKLTCEKYIQGQTLELCHRSWSPGQGLPGWLLQHKAAYLTNRAQEDKQFDQDFRQAFDIHSALSIPILDAKDTLLGCIQVHNKEGTSGFTHFDQQTMIGISQVASIAIQNALAYQKLQEAEALHSHLLNKIMTAQEDERRRISRELHDEIGQSLTSLLVGLRAAEEDARSDGIGARVHDLRKITSTTLQEVQRLARGLRPSILDDFGLEEAIARYGAEFSSTYGIEVDVAQNWQSHDRLPPAMETALYRILQEALTNVGKYAKATTVSILLQRNSNQVRLIVEDNGQGFDVEEIVRKAATGAHLGLHGMRERTLLLNGSISIESSSGAGTTIYVNIPLKRSLV
ncbi:MAG: PAS domain-containing sensor histidine kinase [Nitrospirales bacterium]|nr:PAS domain-containing sensor histidine kinase [Nitrospirales bacterium]